MNVEDDILSAEYALGLLDGNEQNMAHRRIASDLALATRVDWWRDQFEPLSTDDYAEPSATLWSRIDAMVPRNDNSIARIRRWRAAALASMLLAASLGAIITLRPVTTKVAPAPMPAVPPLLLASLTGKDGVGATIAYNTAGGRLTIVPGTLDTSKNDAELWIIPAGGKAHSLGTINPIHPATSQARTDIQRLIGVGATFAITLEPRGGSPSGEPTGPIVASGVIAGA